MKAIKAMAAVLILAGVIFCPVSDQLVAERDPGGRRNGVELRVLHVRGRVFGDE